MGVRTGPAQPRICGDAVTTTFTPHEFMEQVCHFRELMGSRDFMLNKKHQHQAAVDGLAFAYASLELDTPNKEVIRCASVLDSTLTEFTQRQSFLMVFPPKIIEDFSCI